MKARSVGTEKETEGGRGGRKAARRCQAMPCPDNHRYRSFFVVDKPASVTSLRSTSERQPVAIITGLQYFGGNGFVVLWCGGRCKKEGREACCREMLTLTLRVK